MGFGLTKGLMVKDAEVGDVQGQGVSKKVILKCGFRV